MIKQQLEIIDFKNRIWLLFIVIPVILLTFTLTFSVYFIFRDKEDKIGFYLTFAFFIFENYLITIYFSKFRYVKNGQLNFNEEGVFTTNTTNNLKLSWENIKDIDFYYRGDKFWRYKTGNIRLNKGKQRYFNLQWVGIKGLDERIIDRIDVNGFTQYVKIRNQMEKDILFQLISFSKSKGCNVKIMETDFSTKLFGKKV